MIKVFNLSELIKYVFKILTIFITIFFLLKLFSNINNKNKINVKNKAMLFCIDDMLPEIKASSNNVEEKESKKMALKNSLVSELAILDSIKNKEENIVNSEINETNSNEEINNIEENTNVVTKVQEGATVTEVQNSGVNPRSTDEYNGVKINNSTDYTLTEDILSPNIEINKQKVVIYHTHTCESYTPTEKYGYESSGSFRTINLDYSVARVGNELSNQLITYGINVIHDKTYHDYPAYNGSYSRSLATAQNILKDNNDADIVIDLHRDAIADESYAPKVKIGDEYVSQLMFVIGSDGSNKEHTNWNQNLKFAVKVQKKANEIYPGLFKPIIFRNSEYNQHISKAACIIEVGSTGNTLEESMGAMKYLAKILNEI